jgi:hypothetical protein
VWSMGRSEPAWVKTMNIVVGVEVPWCGAPSMEVQYGTL